MKHKPFDPEFVKYVEAVMRDDVQTAGRYLARWEFMANWYRRHPDHPRAGDNGATPHPTEGRKHG